MPSPSSRDREAKKTRGAFALDPGRDDEPAALGHGVARIHRSVQTPPPRAASDRHGRARRRREVERYQDPASQRPGQHLGKSVQSDVDVEDFRLDAPGAGRRRGAAGSGSWPAWRSRRSPARYWRRLLSGRSGRRSSMSAEPETTVIRLLKSCAMPPVSSPSDWSLCACARASWHLLQFRRALLDPLLQRFPRLLHRLVKPRVVDRDRRLGGDADDQPLMAFGELAGCRDGRRTGRP